MRYFLYIFSNMVLNVVLNVVLTPLVAAFVLSATFSLYMFIQETMLRRTF